jgi:hypothetical protein
MTLTPRLDLDDRLRHLETRLDRLLDQMTRLADDLDHAAGRREAMEAGLVDLRTDVQRGFADLRNAVRHFGVRIGESERYRLR